MSKQSDTFLSNALATIAPGVNRNVIARTKPNPNPNPNPNPFPYPILNLKVNHYEYIKPFLQEMLSPEQMLDHLTLYGTNSCTYNYSVISSHL